MYQQSLEFKQSGWLEAIFFGLVFQLAMGLCFVVIAPAVWFWGVDFWVHLNDNRIATLVVNTLSMVFILIMIRRIVVFASGEVLAYIFPIVSVVFLFSFSILLFTRGEYSRQILTSSYVMCLAWCFIGYFVGRKFKKRSFAVLPHDEKYKLKPTYNMKLHYLSKPDLHSIKFDAIIADLRSTKMTSEWERFLAKCILANIPVYNINQVIEGITGKVAIDHLTENELGALLPSPLYTMFKRIIDILGVLILLPLVIPISLITAAAIKLDSKGPILFIQNRVGLGNNDFKIFKFRSMRTDAESEGAKLASENDNRITKVGQFIRKTRIDELPQLINVLRGDMSLIGPRPEQRVFVDQFEHEIPFYIYRHVVRPGITGWAQVTQGYTDDADSTRIKIQHDFYYIKNFSLWLDILIALKTIKVLITGWGAR